jgi:hypothetical protein
MDQVGMLYVLCLFTGLCVFASGLCLLASAKLHFRVKRLREELDALREQGGAFREPPRTDGAAHERPGGGGRFLRDPVLLKARLEKRGSAEARVPEKYRYVARLARSGMGPSELADILEVSENEAEQMLAMARSAEASSGRPGRGSGRPAGGRASGPG